MPDAFDVEYEEEKDEVEKADNEKVENKNEQGKKDEKESKSEQKENNSVVEKSSEKVAVVNKNPINDMEINVDGDGVIEGEMGDEVSKFPIEKMKFSERHKERISVMRAKPVILKSHFDEDVGSFRCFGGKCCEKLGLPDVRYLFPIVVYDTNKRGIPTSKEVDVKVLKLSRDLYRSLIDKHEATGDISTKDILVTCNDEEYQRVTFTVAGNAKWLQDKEVKKHVYNFWKDNNEYFLDAIARKISEEDYIQQKGLDTIDEQMDDDEDFDDVFDN